MCRDGSTNQNRIIEQRPAGKYRLVKLSHSEREIKTHMSHKSVTRRVPALRDQVMVLTGIPHEHQQLRVGPRVLQDGDDLQELSLEEGTSVILLLRLRGGMQRRAVGRSKRGGGRRCDGSSAPSASGLCGARWRSRLR